MFHSLSYAYAGPLATAAIYQHTALVLPGASEARIPQPEMPAIAATGNQRASKSSTGDGMFTMQPQQGLGAMGQSPEGLTRKRGRLLLEEMQGMHTFVRDLLVLLLHGPGCLTERDAQGHHPDEEVAAGTAAGVIAAGLLDVAAVGPKKRGRKPKALSEAAAAAAAAASTSEAASASVAALLVARKGRRGKAAPNLASSPHTMYSGSMLQLMDGTQLSQVGKLCQTRRSHMTWDQVPQSSSCIPANLLTAWHFSYVHCCLS